jgi:50S ribosomal protein L16 3-hydroxylase
VGRWQLDLDPEDFLANYWQKKPLLMRQAIPDFEPPVDANELAGLALEDVVESRIIEYSGDNWHLSHGPFEAGDFDRAQPWTLLVQAVDHYIPEVAQLRQLVGFIPQWRIDDVMISYAVDGGSVGPHYDNYDVFLIQGEGTRRWKVGQACDDRSSLLAHDQLRILAEFQCEEEHILTTGDILYLPPGVAHWGIAEGECMTYSIGFRAPRINDLLSRRVDAYLEQASSERFYRDPPLSMGTRPGEIRLQDLNSAKDQLLAALAEKIDETWFGELLTEPKYDLDQYRAEAAPKPSELRQPGARLIMDPVSKIAWQEMGGDVVVFANGEALPHDDTVIPLLTSLCQQWRIEGQALTEALDNPECAILLGQLLERGCLELEQ